MSVGTQSRQARPELGPNLNNCRKAGQLNWQKYAGQIILSRGELLLALFASVLAPGPAIGSDRASRTVKPAT